MRIGFAMLAALAVLLTPSRTHASGPVAGSWASGSPMPTARSEVTSAVVNASVFVVGGFTANGSNTDVVEAYDTASNTWSTRSPLPQRRDHAMAAAVNGKVYVFGGYTSAPRTISSTTYEYDPIADTWTPRASMPLARAAAAAVAVNGKVYVVGGVGTQPTVAMAYDQVANSWSQLAPMSAPREHLSAAAISGEIYVAGGRWSAVNTDKLEVYDPAANSWQTLTPMPTARGGLAVAPLGGRVHVVGGEELSPGGSTFDEHEVYDPAASWKSTVPLPTARHGLSAQTIGGKLYVLAGGRTPGLSVSDLVEVFTPESVGGVAELPSFSSDSEDTRSPARDRTAPLAVALGVAAAVALACGFWYRRKAHRGRL